MSFYAYGVEIMAVYRIIRIVTNFTKNYGWRNNIMMEKLNVFMALVMTMTTIFGGTLCYAAEAEAGSDEVYETEQSNEGTSLARGSH